MRELLLFGGIDMSQMIFSNIRVTNFQSIPDSGILELGPISLLVGRNNSGKSALLRAVYLAQEGIPRNKDNIRIGEQNGIAHVTLGFDRLPPNTHGGRGEGFINGEYYPDGGSLEIIHSSNNDFFMTLTQRGNEGQQQIDQWPSKEPYNIIYPSLARRQVQYYNQQPTIEHATTVYPQDSNLVSRVAAFATAQIPAAERFRALCEEVLGFTVDVLLGRQQNQNQQLGIQVSRFDSIPLEAMGAGVSSILGLLLNLCDAQQKLFLIEEPENDLHPQALKALLNAIILASESNQFIITTHSSIVLTKLGALSRTVVLETSSNNLRLPSSTYKVVASTEERVEVLRQLGYEFADFYLGEGWLIFEESSAERIVRDWLIPWFVPGVRPLRTVAAKGTSRVTALAQSLAEMLVFVHLEKMYEHRAWVIVDGDESGRQVVKQLREKYPSWPEDNFLCWEEKEFENYYPECFKNRVSIIMSTPDKAQRRELKKALLDEVIAWIIQDPKAAREAFETSAAEVIEKLTKIAECV